MKHWIVLIVLLLAGITTLAQDTSRPVTADDVNAIAEKMFCPVCENIPLDSCGTDACNDWRDEIRMYLEQGWTEEAIISDFVMRFGDRVVGTPQDPFLRALSLVTPWVLIAAAVVIVLRLILRWRKPEIAMQGVPEQMPGNAYREMLEKDLRG
jgi:cytochrome c-type biogenesis protein CcmH